MVATRPNANPIAISLALKVVGAVLLTASLLDYVVLFLPPQLKDAQWRFQFTTQLIDRGIVPLIGISLIMLGLWMAAALGEPSEPGRANRPASADLLKPITMAIAGFLGFLFLMMSPLHIVDAGKASAAATRQVNNQTSQVEQQLEFRLQQERAQIDAILANPEQLKQLDLALQQPGLPAEEKQRIQTLKKDLERFQGNPAALGKQQEQARTLALDEIRKRNQTERGRISTEFNKSRARIGLSGLLISAAYLLICWMGFQTSGRR